MNQLDISLTLSREIKSRLLYKPTAVYSGSVILKLKMVFLNDYKSFHSVIIWNRKIVKVRTDLYLLIYDFIENLLYTRHCVSY